MNRKDLRLLSLGLLALLGAACRNGSYGSVTVTQQTGDPATVLDLSSNEVAIAEGSATSAHIEMHAVDGDVMPGGDLQSVNPSVLQIMHTPDDANRYMFLGVFAGTTQVRVIAGGRQVATVVATVLPPAATSIVAPAPDAGTGTPSADAGPVGADAAVGSDAGGATDAGADARD